MTELRWMSERLDPAQRASALAMLSDAERSRHDDAVPSRRDPFLAGRLLLRTLAAELTGEHPAAVPLVAVCPDCGGQHGRPELVGSKLQLSLSHGAGVVVAAAHSDARIGVDIEALDPQPDALSAVGMVAGEASLTRWTRVEAVLKADGRGLRVDPAEVHFSAVPSSVVPSAMPLPAVHSADVSSGDGGVEARITGSPLRYRVTEVDLAPDLRVSIAVEAERFRGHPHER